MSVYHIDNGTLVSGPHHEQSQYVKLLTGHSNPECLDLTEHGLLPEVRPEIDTTQQYGELVVYLDRVEWSVEPRPAPTVEAVMAALELAVDQHIESVARAKRYGTATISPRASCVSYAGFPNPFQAEAIKYAQWVAACYVRCGELIAEVEAGQRPTPTEAELIALLPVMVW